MKADPGFRLVKAEPGTLELRGCLPGSVVWVPTPHLAAQLAAAQAEIERLRALMAPAPMPAAPSPPIPLRALRGPVQRVGLVTGMGG
jgi:hypothetical protein